MAAIWGAVITAVASLAGSAMQSQAAKKAASQQGKAGEMAVAEQAREFDIARSQLAPFQSVGTSALYSLRDYMGLGAPGSAPTPEQLMAQDPGYQFRLDQGNKAITNAASARGMNLSGATLQELLRYGQDYASGEFSNIIGRLSGVANMGQASAAGSATLSGQQGQSTANIIQGMGNVQAAGTIASANAYSNSLNNISSMYTLKQILNQNNSTSGQTGGVSSALPEQIQYVEMPQA